MDKIIDFFKNLFLKTAESLNKDKAAILKTFTDAATDLEALNEKIEKISLVHDAKIIAAQAKIDLANLEKVALADAKAANAAVAGKIKALLS